jgi:hypothetical protein
MLDAGYLMLVGAERRSRFSGDMQECTRNEIRQHPVSRNRYPGSHDIANDFQLNDLDPEKHFMQLKGLC